MHLPVKRRITANDGERLTTAWAKTDKKEWKLKFRKMLNKEKLTNSPLKRNIEHWITEIIPPDSCCCRSQLNSFLPSLMNGFPCVFSTGCAERTFSEKIRFLNSRMRWHDATFQKEICISKRTDKTMLNTHTLTKWFRKHDFHLVRIRWHVASDSMVLLLNVWIELVT